MTAKGERLASVAVVLLAAGASSRMGPDAPHKLLAEFGGLPLIRRSTLLALTGSGDRVVVVTGHRHQDIAAAICDLDTTIVHNRAHIRGMAHSLRLGVAAAQRSDPDGIMVMLADMPALTTSHLKTLIAAFRANGATRVIRAMAMGLPGNPLIFPRSLYHRLLTLDGDAGARNILARGDVVPVDIEIGAAARTDVDTPDDVIAAGGKLG